MKISVANAFSRPAIIAVKSFISEMTDSLPADKVETAHELRIRQDLFEEPRGLFLLAVNDNGGAVGCAGLHRLSADTAELSRFWVARSERRAGIGSLLLRRFEEEAVRIGIHRAVLQTHEKLVPAVRLYLANGWVETSPHKANSPASHGFEKLLT